MTFSNHSEHIQNFNGIGGQVFAKLIKNHEYTFPKSFLFWCFYENILSLQKYLQHTIKGKIKVDCLIAGALHSLQRYLHLNDGSVCSNW